jgi:urease accessory protein
MKANAELVVELGETGCTIVRALRSVSPWTLLPQRTRVHRLGARAVVHLVCSATAPLGGDDLQLTVSVGPGASLRLSGVAATLALPGHGGAPSRARVHFEIADGGSVEYLPEPTVVTRRAVHSAQLTVNMAGSARFRGRDVLVLGRSGERPGLLTSEIHVVRDGTALLRQQIDTGDEELGRSPAYLAGRRVLATEFVAWGPDPPEAVSGDWWSLVPMAGGGSLATALALDAVTALRELDSALAAHPGLVSF